MQVYRFIFLARSWASDRLYLIARLSELGRDAQAAHKPLAFIIYPEGTLVSSDTRPVSKKYADKLGIVNGHSIYQPGHSILTSVTVARHEAYASSAIDWTTLCTSSVSTESAITEIARYHSRLSRLAIRTSVSPFTYVSGID